MKWWRSATSSVISRIPTWVAALWWASLTTIGFLVVPMLFATLPTAALAGGMAAKLFSAQTGLSCVCGLLLLLCTRSNHPMFHRSVDPDVILFIAGGMLLSLLSEFAVAPHIVAHENLHLWHGVGSAMFVLQWVCATVVQWKLTAHKTGA